MGESTLANLQNHHGKIIYMHMFCICCAVFWMPVTLIPIMTGEMVFACAPRSHSHQGFPYHHRNSPRSLQNAANGLLSGATAARLLPHAASISLQGHCSSQEDTPTYFQLFLSTTFISLSPTLFIWPEPLVHHFQYSHLSWASRGTMHTWWDQSGRITCTLLMDRKV